MSEGPRAALYGHPVAHSRSPALMAALGEATGRPLEYVLRDVTPAALPRALAALRVEDGAVGANVTVPHKLAALADADGLAATAQAAGAANVLVREGHRLIAHNTDGDGFLDALAFAGCDPAGARALLIGAGGAARAVGAALLGAGVEALWIHNRSLERAVWLQQLDPGRTEILSDTLFAPAQSPPPVDLVVHATSLGLHDGDQHRLDGWIGPLLASLGDRQAPPLAVDVVYAPADAPTAFGALASRYGLRPGGDGRAMLAAQAARAFSLWQGLSVGAADVLPQLLRALDTRPTTAGPQDP